jgi:hypothetical protein
MIGLNFFKADLGPLKQIVNALPDTVTAECQRIAFQWAKRVELDAKRRLTQQTKGEGNTAAALQTVEDMPNKQYIVGYGPIKARPRNLPLWLEYGTVRMLARPHMRPSAEAARDGYTQDMKAATEAVVRDAFNIDL